MKKIFLGLLLSIFLCSATLFSSEGTRVEKSIEVVGYGKDQTTAIQNALIEAIKQKHGVYIQSLKGVFTSYLQSSSSKNGQNDYKTAMNDAMIQSIKSATQGYIDNYQVVDMTQEGSDYKATVRIVTVQYKAPGYSANRRRKIVVVPSYSENTYFDIFGRLVPAKEVSYNLTEELINDLTQTRKFSVLDRENSAAYNQEKKLILSPDASKEEILKLGNVLGTDYLVISTIKEFRITNKKIPLKAVGQVINKVMVSAMVQYKIIVMATRQVKWSSTLEFNFKPKGKNAKQMFYDAIRRIGKKLTYEIIANVYPIRINDISANGDAILNQKTKVGDIYNVYAVGKKLYDPYTKEFLGYDEVKIGVIQVVRSLAKVSYAKVIEGRIQRGSICRKANKTKRLAVNIRKKEFAGQQDRVGVVNQKKYIAIKPLEVSRNIDKYKYRYIKDANIALKIKDLVNKSKKYKVLSRSADEIKAMMEENEFSKSDLTDNMSEDAMKFANVDYQLIPKITKFKIYTLSKKIPYVDAYDNKDYIKMELNVVVLDRKGEVVFESTKTQTYTRSWSSEKKLRRKRPPYSAVNKVAQQLVSKVLYDLLNKKAQMLSKKFITVVEVNKNSIYLDLGDNTDIKEGDIFPVYHEPKVKLIKRTGKTRLSYGEKIAVVKIDGIYDDGAEAIVIKGKISNIKEGDVLRVKRKRK